MVARADFWSGFSQTYPDFEQTRCFRRNSQLRRYNALKAQEIASGFKHFPDEEGTERQVDLLTFKESDLGSLHLYP